MLRGGAIAHSIHLVCIFAIRQASSSFHLSHPTSVQPTGGTRHRAVRLGLFDWLSTLDDAASSPQAEETIQLLCRSQGWDVRCDIGRDVARAVGGTGSLATGPDGSATCVLDLKISFSEDVGYVPPQGQARLLRASRFLADDTGFWKVEADSDDGVPQQVQWRLDVQKPDGLVLGGQTLLPPGPLYFNARCSLDAGRLSLYDGRLTVKEDIGVNAGLFQAKGILAEFKIVGTFDVRCTAQDDL